MARQIDIWDRYSQEENLDKKKEIKKVIIEEYINLVKIIAGKLYNYYASNIEYDDLMSYGVIGLIDAIDKYDPTKNIMFETYASIRIRGSIIHQIRNLDWIPRSIRQKSKILKYAFGSLISRTRPFFISSNDFSMPDIIFFFGFGSLISLIETPCKDFSTFLIEDTNVASST